MRNPNARSCATLIFSVCVLSALTSCADTKVVYRDKEIRVEVPVFVPLPEELLAWRAPKLLYPPDSMPVGAIEDKVEALELALGMCNNDKELIRAKQPTRR